MLETLLETTLEEIKNGFYHDSNTDSFICNICSAVFENGEVFESGGRYFDARKMAGEHVRTEHGAMLDILSANHKKDTGLTEKQRDLLSMIASGISDAEIARANGLAASTIRHQKFVFREKAKQAKLYLAIYELAMQGAQKQKVNLNENDDMIDIHKCATMVDDRYLVTKAEEEAILTKMFSSLSPLRLNTFATKEKKKLVILRKIYGQFDKDRIYSEKEVNGIIQEIYDDYATIRRYLIEYGFMDRTIDCREYWLK